FSRIYNALLRHQYARLLKDFPRGLPSTGNIGSEFLLEEGIDWVAKRLPQIPQPFMGYFHFLPPHGPYNTSLQFYDHFAGDGFQPPDKPEDVFTRRFSRAALLKRRREYDEFILYVDDQFGRFFGELEASGLLDNTWLILTSDHGELNERGISGHSTDALFEPVLRVPLLIFEPGRTSRLDVFDATSAADVLPTVASLAGQAMPDWGEGLPLPPFAEAPATARSLYAVKADKNAKLAPLEHASLMMLKEDYKLLYSYGLKGPAAGELVRLFDIKSDPEEMNDLYTSSQAIADELLHELKSKIQEVNQPYL
ncbi:MAG TPA: sulfatase-like hydrolase/transferase, partial [Anaerolineales bacterium]